MTTARAVREDINNLLDYLLQAEIAAYINTVSITGRRVSWHPLNPAAPFLTNRGDPCLQDYKGWLDAGAYSALLFDGALLQITYDIEGGEISGHRLAYVPCPYRLDAEMVRRDAVSEIVDLHIESDPTGMVLHSAVRFDYDPESAGPGHPSAHMTINSVDCRIACAAPMHVGRFADFIFRHFYPDIRFAHLPYFAAGASRDIGVRTLAEEDRGSPHMSWT
ncbi:DUF2290 domain-containing protein [Streptomyces sp. NBC_00828]|uniref:DUF2290 domain-containing protein n=1 Tax=Streptomyces sp. NBC_00828 TaxID=2903678 RepID=UPI00386ACD28